MLKYPTFTLFMTSRSFNFDLICCEKRKSDKAAEMIMGTAHDSILDFPFFSSSCWIIFVGSYCIGRRHGPRLMNGQIIGGNS